MIDWHDHLFPDFFKDQILIVGLIIAFGLLTCGCDQKAVDNQKNSRKEDQKCISVQVARVKTMDLPKTVKGIGTLEAIQRIVVRSEVAGLIKRIYFQEGQKARQGQILFQVDKEKIQKRLQARQAALNEAQAKLEDARRTFRRRQNLYERDLISAETRDKAETEYQMAEARVDRLKAEIGELKEIMRDTRIDAPFDGILGERLVDQGDWVDVGSPLVSLVQQGRIKIAFTLAERYLNQIKVGQKVNIWVQAYPQKRFSGQIYFVSPEIKDQTRSFLVKAYLDNKEQLLQPGGFATVEVNIDVHKDTPVIPEEALVPTRSGYNVFVVKDSLAKLRKVDIGLRRPGIVEITKGLKPGETVVRTGHITLPNGALICPVNQAK